MRGGMRIVYSTENLSRSELFNSVIRSRLKILNSFSNRIAVEPMLVFLTVICVDFYLNKLCLVIWVKIPYEFEFNQLHPSTFEKD